MFGRSSTSNDERVAEEESARGRHAGDTRTVRDEPVSSRRDYDRDYARGVDPVAAQEARKERFGGLNGGAAFFGWLVAMAVSLLLTGIVGAIAAGLGTRTPVRPAPGQAAGG